MRLIFLFLFAIAAALPSAHAQTPLIFTSNATLPSSPAGSPASIPVQITGGTQPYSFALKRGQTLPTGLVLNNSTGVISGTPRGPSSTEIQVQVRDSGSPVRYKAKNFTLPISGDAPALPTFKVIPSVAQVDKPFSFTLNATRGRAPYTFTTNSTLPAGLSLSASGVISGTPLPAAAPQAAKDFPIVVRVTGSNAIPQSSARTYTLTVSPAAPPSFTTKTLPDAEMGEEYLFDDLVVTGGKPPYKFKAAAAFPTGLAIAEDGTISGIPKTPGTYRLRISATDANNRTGTAFVSLIVSDAPTPKITTVTTLYWARNQTISTTLAATAGRAPYKWAKTGASKDELRNLPAGVTLNQNGTFSGAPTVANTFTVAIRVTDDLGKGSTKTLTIIVSASSLAITSPEVLEPAYLGVSPNLNLTAQGGIAPYTWTLKNRGTLPSTITLNSAGRLSGTANATGNFSFTAEVADSRNGTVAKAEKQLTLPVINYNLAIATTSLPAGTAGSSYAATPLVATGGKPPYTWSFTSTPALSGLSASTGNLTGKPAAAGNYTLALKVTDANSRSVTSNLTLRVNEPDALAFDPLTLPNGRVGTSYNGTLGAKGGFSPYTFTLKTGNALPAGLSLASATGVITGKPTTAGTFKFIVVLKDSKKPTAATIEREFTLVIDAYGMSIDGLATITGKRYGSITPAQFSVTGGTANYTWSTAQALPAALNLDSKTGLVSGNLTAAVGNYTVAIKVTDGNRQFATRNLTVSITQPDPVVWVTPATLPEGQVGGNYTAVELAASGGKAPYTYALKIGNRLPSGLALSAGKISGTPRVAGTFKFTLVASDSQSPAKATAEREFTLVIKPAVPLAITAPNPMPTANVGSVYGPASFTASGGLPPYTWSVTPSPAAPGLTFSGGNLTGTPTTAGNYTFTVRVVDSASANATRTITLPVGAAIPLEWVTAANLPGGQVLTTYNATLTTSGGIGPVTITRISGNLSAGLTQSGTRISGTPTAVGNATFTLQARDKNGVTANRTFTLPVAPYDLAVSADAPSFVSGTVNQPFASEPFNAEGGKDPYVWSIVGTKPAWLKIDSDSGVLSGTSNATGNFTIVVSVKDGNAQTANKTCAISIGLGEPPVLDATQQLPAGMVGVPYPNTPINADGGLEPYRFTLKNGSSLPAGLSINATSGVISGTPSAAGNTTTTIVVAGANGASAERAYTIRIDAYDLAISSEVPWVLQGQVYKDFGPLPLEATGGLEPYKWSMTPASIANLTLDASGTLTGRPATAGNFSVTFRVVDARNATVTKNATIQIAPAAPVEFTTEPNLPNGKVATPYGGDVTILPVPTPVAGITLAGKGGLAPYTYSFKTGSTPPPGLNLSTAGKITGTPTTAGTFKFFVVIKDSKNTTAEREFTLVVEPYSMIVSGPDTIAGDQYSTITPAAFTAVGGIANYTWSVNSTTGLTINATTGVVSGSLTAAPGNYTLLVTVRDGRNQTASQNVTVSVSPAPPLTISTESPLPSGTINGNYTQNFVATGGRPSAQGGYTWAIASPGNLPVGANGFSINATTGLFKGKSATAFTANFTIKVTDSNATIVTKPFTLTIGPGSTPTNNLPTISSIANQTTNEDTATEAVEFTVGDVETPLSSLTITASSGNTTLIPNGNIVLGGSGANRTVTVTPAANQSGNATITMSVGDGTATANTTFTVSVVEVNDLPTISLIANQTTNEDTATGALAFTVGDVETPLSSLTITASSSNATLIPNSNVVLGGSGANRTVTVTPAANQSGNATITVSVGDGTATANTTFTVSVVAVNDLPTISSIANQTTNEDTATEAVAFTVGDQETSLSSLTITASSSNTTLIPSSNVVLGGSGVNRTVTVTPAANQSGNATITVSVGDGTASANTTFTVSVVAVNDLPTISSIANQTTGEDTPTGALAFTVGDVETPLSSLTITASSGNTTLIPNGNIVFGGSGANRTVTVTPAANQSGNASITVSVSDGTASTNTTFTVGVTEVNDLPTISSITNQTTNEDTPTGALAFTVGDLETPAASLSVSASSSSTTLIPSGNIVFGGSGANRTVTVTPAANQSGNATITVSVGDGTASANTTFTVGVTAVNDLPTISSIANQTTNEDTPTGAVVFTVGDLETPAASLTITASSSNVTLIPSGNIVLGGSGANRTVTVTPAANQSGNATITMSVGDGTATANTTFTVSVAEVNDLPTISSISNQTTNEDTATGGVAFTVGDQETPLSSLTITASSGNTTLIPNGNIVLGGSGANRTVTVTPAANQSGNATITVSVGDGTASANTTFTVGVAEVNDLPTISSIANQTTGEDTPTGALVFTVGDVETPLSSLTITASSGNTTLIPSGNIVLGGSGANRTVTVTPAANQSGNATITVSVGDGTASANTTFTMGVTAVNDLPTISSIANQTTGEDTPTGALAFTVGDVETPLSSLTITASSGYTTLIPSGNIVLGGSGANRTVMVNPAANQSGNATITVSVSDGTVTANTTFTVVVTAVNDLPTISSIANQTTNEDTATGALAFTVGDQETPLSSLTVSVSSSNTTLIPNSNVVLGGGGSNRTVTVTPAANQSGNATITVSAGDGTATANTTFTVSVVAVNDPPTISDISNASAYAGSATDPIGFVVGDLETPVSSLTVLASSGNTTLVPNSNIVLGGSGANRTVTITPALSQGGNATITVSVGDGALVATKSFTITVKPSTKDMVAVLGGTLPQASFLANQTVSSFQIGRYEVTWSLWQEVRNWAVANGYTDLANIGNGSSKNHPVTSLTWHDAVRWCNARSQMEGLSPVYSVNGTVYKTSQIFINGGDMPVINPSANGYRVPTEVEWEWAARGGIFSKAFTYSGSNQIDDVAWYGLNARSPMPVGTKAPNEMGVYDMSGNVWEWCWDMLEAPYSNSHRFRGGSSSMVGYLCAVADRSYMSSPGQDRLGFRVARNIIGDMVTVQGGTLPQGSSLANQTVSTFQIGRTEVTWEEWQSVRAWATANGYTDLVGVGVGIAGNYPATSIGWYDVVKWCNAKSEKEGLSPVYSINGTIYKTGEASPNVDSTANGYRLPTIQEFEWAARGGVQSQGYTYSGSNDVNAVCWEATNSAFSVKPVAAKSHNELGIFDMSGNVMEWCEGLHSGAYRVLRGGSFTKNPDWSTVSFGGLSIYNSRNGDFGFRLVRNIGPKISISGTLPEATLNQAYAGYTFGAVGSTGDKVWSISEGTLPPGMSFSANGTLSGTPTTAGTYTFVIRLDSSGYWDEVEIVLQVVASGLVDADNDGVNDYRETYDGTNPNDPQSFDSLSIGLLAHYPFDGNANDETKNGFDATGSNFVFAQDRNGATNSCLALTSPFATSKKVYLTSTANRTFSEWVKVVEFPAKTSGAWGPKPNANFAVYPQSVIIGNHFSADGQWWMDTGDGVAFYNIIASNQWKHLTVVYQGDVSKAKVFLNGALVPLNRMVFGKVAFDSGEFSPIKFDPVAWNTSGLSSLNLIDNVRVYNRALSDSEVAQLYAKETDGANMVLVQGGTLPTGSGLAGQVVQTFNIDRFEVTWEEWQTVQTYVKGVGH